MPLRLDVKRCLSARSDRVKSVDLHPNEPWLLVALYNGRVHIWNYETQSLYKSFEVRYLNASFENTTNAGERTAGALCKVRAAQELDSDRLGRHASASVQL